MCMNNKKNIKYQEHASKFINSIHGIAFTIITFHVLITILFNIVRVLRFLCNALEIHYYYFFIIIIIIITFTYS